MARSGKGSGNRGQLRIIAGQWRGRKLSFIPGEGLRPTTDRVRETLFNWLAPHINGARCADLYAGSGALGLEALSRGARYCDFVDSSDTALEQITGHLATLDATGQAGCHPMSALHFLDNAREPYDIAFIDPPFDQDLAGRTCTLLARNHLLTPSALVYVEIAASTTCPALPPGWILHREKTAGGVTYRLFTVDPE